MRKNKSVIVEWIISYIIILLIPIVTIVINYHYNTQIIKEEIYHSNELVLNNLSDSVDKNLDEQRALYAFIITNNTFRKLATSEEKDAWFYYDVSEMQDQLSDYNQWRTQMHSVIYFPETDYIIGRDGNHCRIYYSALDKTYQQRIGYTEWKDLLEGDYQQTFMISSFLNGKNLDPCIVYANSYSVRNHEKVNVFVNIPITEIEQLTKKLEPGTNFIITIDGKTLLAVNTEGVVNIPEQTDFLLVKEKQFETEEYMIVRNPSINPKVAYYMQIPKRDFWKQFQYIQNLFFGSLLLTLFVGVFCVSLLVRRNFRPLKKLYSKVGGDNRRVNEFLEIENIYSTLIAENHIMKEKIDTEEDALRNYYLLSLMKGRTGWLQKKDAEGLIMLDTEEVLMLTGFLVPSLGDRKEKADDLMLFTVNNIYSEMMEQEKFYRIEDGRFLFYLHRVSRVNGWKEQYLERTAELCTFIYENLGETVVAAVSGYVAEISGMELLYHNVMDALEFKSAVGGYGVINTEEWQRNKGIVEEIIEYIENHYEDSNLNVNSVAEGIKRNSKYISKTFREETGLSILDYIHNLRIRKAQILMRSGEYSLEEISEKVGYASIMTFRRAFVKIVGVIPGKYKEE